jgi:ABC-type sugar transport system substrate-binding protein
MSGPQLCASNGARILFRVDMLVTGLSAVDPSAIRAVLKRQQVTQVATVDVDVGGDKVVLTVVATDAVQAIACAGQYLTKAMGERFSTALRIAACEARAMA